MPIQSKEKLNHSLIITFLVFSLPLFMYIHLLFPDADSFMFFGFVIDSNGFDSIETYAYYFFVRIYIVSFLTVWFLTVKEFWRFFIAAIIVYFFYQLTEVVSSANYSVLEKIIIASVLGILYVYLVNKISRGISRLKISKVNTISFDILKIIIDSNRVKEVYQKKETNILSIDSQNQNSLNKNRLFDKLKKLESLLHLNQEDIEIAYNRNKKIFSIPLLLLIIPFLYNLHKFLPSNFDSTEIVDLGIFKLESFGFISVSVFVYILFFKVSTLLLLTTWFLTCRYLWKYAILLNIAVVLFQTVNLFANTTAIDENELLHAIPILLPIMVIIFYLGKLIKYKDKIALINIEIEQRINEIIDLINATNQESNFVIKDLNLLRLKQDSLSKEDYLMGLNNLKKVMENKLIKN